jgi:lipocalin
MTQSLVERLGKKPVRSKVIEECVDLIESQVKAKGFMIKSAYATIKALKKQFVPEVVDTLLDDWLGKIQPHYDKWNTGKPERFSDYIIARSDDVAEDLLSVTDERAERSSHGTAKKMYSRMRESAKKNVVEAVPDLARLIERKLT